MRVKDLRRGDVVHDFLDVNGDGWHMTMLLLEDPKPRIKSGKEVYELTWYVLDGIDGPGMSYAGVSDYETLEGLGWTLLNR